mmetsp:Transcript_31699/g.58413  ORF Transcript_31699/g.58413 Transcript_31699/m.58413 type:complete len:273 (+) Transcript_31699:942-1760(+)
MPPSWQRFRGCPKRKRAFFRRQISYLLISSRLLALTVDSQWASLLAPAWQEPMPVGVLLQVASTQEGSLLRSLKWLGCLPSLLVLAVSLLQSPMLVGFLPRSPALVGCPLQSLTLVGSPLQVRTLKRVLSRAVMLVGLLRQALMPARMLPQLLPLLGVRLRVPLLVLLLALKLMGFRRWWALKTVDFLPRALTQVLRSLVLGPVLVLVPVPVLVMAFLLRLLTLIPMLGNLPLWVLMPMNIALPVLTPVGFLQWRLTQGILLWVSMQAGILL